jgi:autoinducer 2 (AI-2) kinase
VLPEFAEKLNLSPETVVVVGGADTQLAIKSTRPAVDDIVIVSGTTTPIVKITEDYITDSLERTWTNRHCEESQFILEANAGVTGLNYQRLKEIFYPNEGYDVIEKELEATAQTDCVASLGSLIAEEKSPLTKGGFVFQTPVSHDLTRASFVRATLWDIACCIKGNYETLCDVTNHQSDYVWACGGGFQSRLLRQFIADLLGKKIYVRSGYQQASVVGGALICSEALGEKVELESEMEIILPQEEQNHQSHYDDWKEVRSHFRKTIVEEAVV